MENEKDKEALCCTVWYDLCVNPKHINFYFWWFIIPLSIFPISYFLLPNL